MPWPTPPKLDEETCGVKTKTTCSSWTSRSWGPWWKSSQEVGPWEKTARRHHVPTKGIWARHGPTHIFGRAWHSMGPSQAGVTGSLAKPAWVNCQMHDFEHRPPKLPGLVHLVSQHQGVDVLAEVEQPLLSVDSHMDARNCHLPLVVPPLESGNAMWTLHKSKKLEEESCYFGSRHLSQNIKDENLMNEVWKPKPSKPESHMCIYIYMYMCVCVKNTLPYATVIDLCAHVHIDNIQNMLQYACF